MVFVNIIIMNREFKFRGKNKIGWIYGVLSYVNIRNKRILCIYDGYADCIVNTDTIGQFTGLCDKNGKEIYEGDILMCIGQREDNKERKYLRKVLFKNGSFCMSVPEYGVNSSLYAHVVNGKLNWEVIGNIYDNPELMEETK